MTQDTAITRVPQRDSGGRTHRLAWATYGTAFTVAMVVWIKSNVFAWGAEDFLLAAKVMERADNALLEEIRWIIGGVLVYFGLGVGLKVGRARAGVLE